MFILPCENTHGSQMFPIFHPGKTNTFQSRGEPWLQQQPQGSALKITQSRWKLLLNGKIISAKKAAVREDSLKALALLLEHLVKDVLFTNASCYSAPGKKTKDLHFISILSFHHSHATSLQNLEKILFIRFWAFALSCFRYLRGGSRKRREPAGVRCRNYKHKELHAAALLPMFASQLLEYMIFLAPLSWDESPCLKNQYRNKLLTGLSSG